MQGEEFPWAAQKIGVPAGYGTVFCSGGHLGPLLLLWHHIGHIVAVSHLYDPLLLLLVPQCRSGRKGGVP